MCQPLLYWVLAELAANRYSNQVYHKKVAATM